MMPDVIHGLFILLRLERCIFSSKKNTHHFVNKSFKTLFINSGIFVIIIRLNKVCKIIFELNHIAFNIIILR